MTTYLKELVGEVSAELVTELEGKLEGVTYYTSPSGRTTCQLLLVNGFVVQGACFGAKTKTAAMERARKNAVAQLLYIEQYLKTERLYQSMKAGE